MEELRLENIYFNYQPKQEVIKNFSLGMEKGEILALIGKSGSGKSTLLKLIAGFESPKAGRIFLRDQCVYSARQNVPPEKRQLGVVFQDYALFPHLNLMQNVEFGIKHINKKQRKEKVDELFELIKLTEHKNKYPHEISGGQQQRVALARALAIEPKIVLLDEPFSNLDSGAIKSLKIELKEIFHKTNSTVIIICHNKTHVTQLADSIAVLRNGELLQKLSWEELFDMPFNHYIRQLFDLQH